VQPAVDLVFDLDQDLYHASAVYAGLDALARRGVVRLRFRRPALRERDLTADPFTVCLELRAPGSPKPPLVAIDLHDQSHVFATAVLERCDSYFKRSFHGPDLAALPGNLLCKIRPFGLNYACRTFGSTRRLFQRAALGLAFRGIVGIRRLRHHVALPKIGAFEQGPAAVVEPTIVFQTRVWEAHEAAPGESEAINEERVALLRALKNAFGARFRGGLVPTPLALARYPRDVSIHPSRRTRYTAMSKRNLIGIYTRGLHDSTAFKLPEYLAASQCIVAEPPRNELPVPLVIGKHFLPFASADECVAACHRLFAEKDLATRMRHANHEYYVSEVEPAAHLGRVLQNFLGLPHEPPWSAGGVANRD
jgi:hypothetical protein